MMSQNVIDAMVDWSLKWQLGFDRHLWKNNEEHRYTIIYDNYTIYLKVTTCEKDLGVHIDSLLSYEDHITKQVKKSRNVAAIKSTSISSTFY